MLLFPFLPGGLKVLTVAGLTPLYILVHYRRAPRVLASVLTILTVPALAMLSATWSAVPDTTLYYGFLYFLTVLLGTLLGAGTDRRAALYGLFAAVTLHAVVSIVFGRFVGWGGEFGGGGGGVAFAGVMGSKNGAADASVTGILIALATAGQSIRERNPLVLLIALGVVAIDLWILRNAHSTGAMIAGIIGMVAVFAMLVGQVLPRATRTAIFLLVAVGTTSAAATQSLWLKPLLGEVLEAAGKDQTLTGRTYIWDRADRIIRAQPIHGVGFNAFWNRGNLEAEGIWRYAGIEGRMGFNFHNTPREIMVHLGIVGLVLYALVALPLFFLLMLRTTRDPTPLAIFFCAYLAYTGVRLGVESVGFGTIMPQTMLISAGLAAALWRRDRQAAPMQMRTG